MQSINDAPVELADAVREFFPAEEWDHAVSVAYIESKWSAFAENNTTDKLHPCGAFLSRSGGVTITAERSLGWFQINVCNLPPDWTPEHLYNTRHNVGTAHDLWARRGWSPWYFSARSLGLI